jgi:kynurenine formamidase
MHWNRLAFIFVVLFGATFAGRLAPQSVKQSHDVTREDILRWQVELSNWGRWGKDDQIGALNLITPEKRRQAAALVKEGVSVSLARTAMMEKSVDNPSPYHVEWYANDTGTAAFDRLSVEYHGIAHTHMDAMDHNFTGPGNKAYNGYAFNKESATSPPGHTRNSIVNEKNGIFTRGILIDIPRLKGLPYLEPGTPIYIEDIEAWERKAGVKVSAGDALFIRTGRWAKRAASGPWDLTKNMAGLHPSVIPWLKQRDVAVMGSDVPQLVVSPSVPNLGPGGDIHAFSMAILGIHLFDNCDLEPLSEAAEAHHRWEFLLTAAPLPIPGGTGSPINPIGTF